MAYACQRLIKVSAQILNGLPIRLKGPMLAKIASLCAKAFMAGHTFSNKPVDEVSCLFVVAGEGLGELLLGQLALRNRSFAVCVKRRMCSIANISLQNRLFFEQQLRSVIDTFLGRVASKRYYSSQSQHDRR